MKTALVVVLFGVAGGYVAFGTRDVPKVQPQDVTPVTTFSRRNLYADAFNEVVLMRPGQGGQRQVQHPGAVGIA